MPGADSSAVRQRSTARYGVVWHGMRGAWETNTQETELERAPLSIEAGAIIWCGKSAAQEKQVVMETWEIKLRRNPAELGKLLRSVLSMITASWRCL